MIDQPHDRQEHHHSLVASYASPEATAARLAAITRNARRSFRSAAARVAAAPLPILRLRRRMSWL